MWSGDVAQRGRFMFGCSQRMLNNDQFDRKALRAESWMQISLHCILEIDTMLSNTTPIILPRAPPPTEHCFKVGLQNHVKIVTTRRIILLLHFFFLKFPPLVKCFIKIQFGNNFTFHVILKSLQQLAAEKSQSISIFCSCSLEKKNCLIPTMCQAQRQAQDNHGIIKSEGTWSFQSQWKRPSPDNLELRSILMTAHAIQPSSERFASFLTLCAGVLLLK